MNTINSLTITLTQTTTNTTGTSRADSHQRNEESEISESHDRREHGGFRGGMLMRNVLQALQSFGFSLPVNDDTTPAIDTTDTNPTQASSSSSLGNVFEALHTFLHGLHQVLKQLGSQDPAPTTTADSRQNASAPVASAAPERVSPSAAQTTATTQIVSSATVSNVQPAETSNSETRTAATNTAPAATVVGINMGATLNTFVNDLRSALLHDQNGYSRFSGRHHGYNNFNVNLQKLITTLSNGNGDDSRYNRLQSDFTDLINTLNGSDTTQAPTLLDFLKKLAGNNSDSTSEQTNTGSILVIQA